MNVRQKQIKTSDAPDKRQAIPNAASPLPEGISTLARGARGKFDKAFNYGRVGKRRRLKRNKPNRRLEIGARQGAMIVGRERRALPTITVSADGTSFTRAHEEGKGRSQEVLLRHGNNLENMVREVRRVVFEALFSGIYQPQDETATASNRHLFLIQGLCTEKGALDASLFFTTKGIKMRNNFAFGMMVRQFFREVDFAGKVVGWASREYYAEKKANPLQVIPPVVRMAPAQTTVGGIYYRRSFPAGDREAELIVRHNLSEFVKGAMPAAKEAKSLGQNSRQVEPHCYPPDGVLKMRNFSMPGGKPMKDDALFRRAISQFFCDSEMARKAISQAIGK